MAVREGRIGRALRWEEHYRSSVPSLSQPSPSAPRPQERNPDSTYRVFRNAISAFLSSAERSRLKGWPFTRVCLSAVGLIAGGNLAVACAVRGLFRVGRQAVNEKCRDDGNPCQGAVEIEPGWRTVLLALPAATALHLGPG
jgi:hypothetical protein